MSEIELYSSTPEKPEPNFLTIIPTLLTSTGIFIITFAQQSTSSPSKKRGKELVAGMGRPGTAVLWRHEVLQLLMHIVPHFAALGGTGIDILPSVLVVPHAGNRVEGEFRGELDMERVEAVRDGVGRHALLNELAE